MRGACLLLLLPLGQPGCTRDLVLMDATTPIGRASAEQTSEVAAHVHCEAPHAHGDPIGCSVSHDGARAYELCWAGEFRCKNATVLRAKTCRDAPPNVELRELLGAAELAGWDRCDTVDEGRLSAAWVVDR